MKTKLENTSLEEKSPPESSDSPKITRYVSQKEEMRNFSEEISNLMSDLQITAMEAIVHFSAKKGIEIEVAAKLVNKDLKNILKEEAASLNFLRYKNGKVIRPKKSKKKKRS